MKLTLYQVDAFAKALFSGNPAGVCMLDKWLPDKLMQNIAMENNLAETAFIVRDSDQYHIRWFTPAVEVDLCGHATLASAHVIFSFTGEKRDQISFRSLSGELRVRKDGDALILNFPADTLTMIETPLAISDAIGLSPIESFQGKTDYMLIYSSQDGIESIRPDMGKLLQSKARGVIVTAPGKESDFVSRFFAPMVGVNEDPVTGSAHTTLIPYWTNKLGKISMTAIQLSKRKGWLNCKYLNDRVEIGGKAVTYLVGTIEV
ncbi:MAG: PhzF family phenazine biosynthesis protein [Bacteroidetes bacterium]|nr:PhzF family phenazine biosynthesis protein [Bacteroidota bacterium]